LTAETVTVENGQNWPSISSEDVVISYTHAAQPAEVTKDVHLFLQSVVIINNSLCPCPR